jgi:hypothetical protein
MFRVLNNSHRDVIAIFPQSTQQGRFTDSPVRVDPPTVMVVSSVGWHQEWVTWECLEHSRPAAVEECAKFLDYLRKTHTEVDLYAI